MSCTAFYQKKSGNIALLAKIGLVMKLTLMLLLFFTFQLSAHAYAGKITIIKKNVPLSEVFKTIERQSGFLFFYDKSLIQKTKPINVTLYNATPEQALDACLAGRDLTYSIKKNKISIKPGKGFSSGLSDMVSVNALVPPVEIRGKVVNSRGEPLQNASVLIAGTQIGTTTNTDGTFTITAPDNNNNIVLEISSVGFETKDIPVGNQTQINVVLQEDVTGLANVVVVGYGTRAKRDVTGATSTVTAKEIAKRPLVRVEQALQGTTPGVAVESTNGQPGAGLHVLIRGTNSITGSNDPLYVIDGYIGGSIESINPNDIESLEILKDASSTAIYGSRGANGVVIISTKTGQQGKPRINFNTWFSKASIPKELDLMNAYDFARTVNSQFEVAGNPDPFTDAQLQDFKTNGGTDWQRAIQQKPWIQNYDLSVSGGSPNVKYRFSLNNLDQPGTIINSWYKKTTFRSNVDVKVNDRLSLKFNVSVLLPQSHNNSYGRDIGSPFVQATEYDPTSPIRDPVTGAYKPAAQFASIQYNPVAQVSEQAVDNTSLNATGTGILTYRILKGLTFTSNTTYSTGSYLSRNLFGPLTGNGFNGSDYASANSGRNRAYQNSNFFTYDADFGDHSINVTALYEQQNGLNESINGNSVNLSSYALGYYNLSLGATQTTGSGYSASSLQSYMGRVNYSYKDKYLLTASLRSDGSSHLTKKYSTFPSVAIAWNLDKENFLKNINAISRLKLRTSYGETGNQAVGAYATIAQINTGATYYYDGTTPSVGTPLGSPVSTTLKWERTAQYDIGIDASFFNNRLTFTGDAYYKKTSDLLYNYQAPFYMGGGTYSRNIGSVENKGLEFSLGGTPVSNGKIRWNSYFTISFNRNKVLDLGGLNNVQSTVGRALVSILTVGRPLGEFIGYQYLGTWKTKDAEQAALYGMKPGDARYVDVNGDHAYTTSDVVPIGNSTPKYTFGFINDISYNNFTLSFMFQGTQGNKVYSELIAYTWGGLGDARNATTQDALNIWTPDNETDNPHISKTSANFINSSRFVYDASYIKLKNLSLAYQLPEKWLSRVKMNSLEVYVSGQNILCITDYPGYDPEVNTGTNPIEYGIEFGAIPNPKTYTFGLRVGF